ncbi:MAG: segregation/condensation protein A [Spirochaetes bacterium]|jgi:segregation and condensation protein A|nr:segregation/condensation protein A [Spirochaetota bacterium]
MSKDAESIDDALSDSSEAAQEKYVIHIDNFDGPLDLLWNLIKRSKIDIIDISISKITEQYILYLKQMEEQNVAIASEFIAMASELLYYKSKILLPSGEIEDEFFIPPLPRELVAKLLEYKRHQKSALEIKGLYEKQSESFTRENDFSKVKDDDEYTTMSLFDLLNAFVDVMSVTAPIEEREIVFDEILVSDRIDFIINFLRTKEQISFKQLFHSIPSIPEIVSTFLACLELAKMHSIKVMQHKQFGTIHLFRNFDPSTYRLNEDSMDLTHD